MYDIRARIRVGALWPVAVVAISIPARFYGEYAGRARLQWRWRTSARGRPEAKRASGRRCNNNITAADGCALVLTTLWRGGGGGQESHQQINVPATAIIRLCVCVLGVCVCVCVCVCFCTHEVQAHTHACQSRSFRGAPYDGPGDDRMYTIIHYIIYIYIRIFPGGYTH